MGAWEHDVGERLTPLSFALVCGTVMDHSPRLSRYPPSLSHLRLRCSDLDSRHCHWKDRSHHHRYHPNPPSYTLEVHHLHRLSGDFFCDASIAPQSYCHRRSLLLGNPPFKHPGRHHADLARRCPHHSERLRRRHHGYGGGYYRQTRP